MFLSSGRGTARRGIFGTGSTEGVSGTGRFDERKVLIDDYLVVFPPATSFFRSDLLLTPVQSVPK